MSHNRRKEIRLKVVAHALHHTDQTLKTHACIDVFARQRLEAAVGLTVKLGEHVIPDFHIPVAVAARHIFGPCAPTGAQVIHDFAVGTARALGAHKPEVFLFAKAQNMAVGQTDDLVPHLIAFFVVLINRGVELVLFKAQNVTQKFDAPGQRLFLKIATPREVAQHFKKGLVASRATHIFDVIGAHAFLARHSAGVFGLVKAKIIALKGHHPCDGKEQGRVFGAQGKAGVVMTAPLLEKFDKKVANFFCTAILHLNSSFWPLRSTGVAPKQPEL